MKYRQNTPFPAALALAGFLSAPPMRAQASASRHEFDVASIRLNKTAARARLGGYRTIRFRGRAETDASPSQMYGPMLQKLLESRFNLKIHSEMKELPVLLSPSPERDEIDASKRELRRLRRQSFAEADDGRRAPDFCDR